MQITPLPPRETAVEACARAIRDSILRGEIECGRRLPPERELAVKLGVNRVTVRGALSRLAGSGLVSVRQGSGYLVHDFRRDGGPDLLPSLMTLAKESGDLVPIVTDLLRVRRHLARAVLEMLVDTLTFEKRCRVIGAIGDFGFAADRGATTDELMAADMDVLSALLDATDSAVLCLCFNPVQAVLAGLPPLRAVIYRDPQRNLHGYGYLIEWLHEPRRDSIEAVVAVLEQGDTETVEELRRRQDSTSKPGRAGRVRTGRKK